jgi:hypothetical protein
MKQSAGRGAESIPTSDCTCVRTIHAPGVVTANEPMGGSTVCPAATARATVPILGTTISSRRGARTASPLPLRGRVAVQFGANVSGYDYYAGMTAAVRASAGGYGRGPLSGNRLLLDSMRVKGNARKPHWRVPRVGRAYVRKWL